MKVLFRILVSLAVLAFSGVLIAGGIYSIKNAEIFTPSAGGIILATFLFTIALIALLSLLYWWILLSDEED